MWGLSSCLWRRNRSRSGSTSLSPGLAYCIALTLAALNPLACLIHCAAMELRLGQSHAPHTTLAGGYTYICEMPLLRTQPQAAATPERLQLQAPAPDTLPRAVYASALTTACAMALIVFLAAFLRSHPCAFSSSFTPPPFTPPRAP